MNLNRLSKYLETDKEKLRIINDILFPREYCRKITLHEMELDFSEAPYYAKYCPRCFKKYEEHENFCYDCLCALKHIKDMKNVRDIEANPEFTFKGTNDYESFDEIFTKENIQKINDFNFRKSDFNRIIKSIKTQALKGTDELAKTNEIDIDELDNLDKVLLFAKSFVEVGFKSHGSELGHFEFKEITIDDRPYRSLQITTLIHELSHFILKEILSEIICSILDCTKNTFIDAISIFILSYSPFTRLIDEYCAHTVEGRFSVFGYQDYSSFISIEQSLDGEMSTDEIEITKSIGNTFAYSVKDILETFIDDDLRSSIREQFLRETTERPNYEMLRLENCNSLKNEGFMKAIWLILAEGFETSSLNVGKLIEYEKCL